MTKTITLTTDYLIIGAGTMGMCFLDELINNSTSLEAIIVDQRDKPGGHWNDAYSFVRLHSPAVTYGVNSRPLGSGGMDLASKSQILSHFELALADLGRFRKLLIDLSLMQLWMFYLLFQPSLIRGFLTELIPYSGHWPGHFPLPVSPSGGGQAGLSPRHRPHLPGGSQEEAGGRHPL